MKKVTLKGILEHAADFDPLFTGDVSVSGGRGSPSKRVEYPEGHQYFIGQLIGWNTLGQTSDPVVEVEITVRVIDKTKK